MLKRIIAAGLSPAEGRGNKQALEAVRTFLGMDLAYISEFVGDRAIFREVDASGHDALIKPGASLALDDLYCPHILAGRLPAMMADTADYPLTRSIAITSLVPVGAHLSVPVRLPDGRAFGMFCCLSRYPHPALNPRDLQVMRLFADLLGQQIDSELRQEDALLRVRQRVGQVIEDAQYHLLYQPIYSFEPLQPLGFEALCRFTAEPRRGPDVWLSEAARVGRGVELELAVLSTAREAFDALPGTSFVSMNASPETILSGRLDAVLQTMPLPRVIIEVTEHAEVTDYTALRTALSDLRGRGAQLAIDDTGAGYASLQHVIQLRPDIIKLDMRLVRGVDADPARRALAGALTSFAREIGCQIVAEGIETVAQFAALKALGIHRGQGHLLGQPIDLEAAACLLSGPRVSA